MSRKTGRLAAFVAVLVAVGTMSLATSALAGVVTVQLTQEFKNWVVSGTLTPKKLNQPVALPQGSTFNGIAELQLIIEEHAKGPKVSGTVTGSVFVPPFNAALRLLGLVPTTVGVTFTQVGKTEGTIASAPESDCAESKGVSGSRGCVTLSVPTKAILGITEVGLLGIETPTHCETVEPVALPLSSNVTLVELINSGAHFTGTATIPPMRCDGLNGPAVGPLLTVLMSGPDNPYSLSITPPKA
jgi:hypothetical protein